MRYPRFIIPLLTLLVASLAIASPTLSLDVAEVTVIPNGSDQDFSLAVSLTSDQAFNAAAFSVNLTLSEAPPTGDLKFLSASSVVAGDVTATNPAASADVLTVLGVTRYSFVTPSTAISAGTTSNFVTFNLRLSSTAARKDYFLTKNLSLETSVTVDLGGGSSETILPSVSGGSISTPEPAVFAPLGMLVWLTLHRRRAA